MKRKLPKWALPLLFIIILYMLPLFISSQYVLRICVYITIYSILSCSLNLISGVAGQVSMGHSAFYGIGAYASTLIAMSFGVPWFVCLIFAFVFAFIVGVLIGIPSFASDSLELGFCHKRSHGTYEYT